MCSVIVRKEIVLAGRLAVRTISSKSAYSSTKKFEDLDLSKIKTDETRWVEYEYEESSQGPLYSTHYPTTAFQKALLAIGSSLSAISDVYRADMVACFGEVTGQCAFAHMYQQMQSSEEGRRILETSPRINTKTVNYQALLEMPQNTLGYTYAKFMLDNKISSDDRPPVHFVDDVTLAYVATRYREVHDLFHVLLAMPTNMLGEVVVKWVEGFQTRLPMAATGGLFGAVRLRPKQRQLYVSTLLPWALKAGFESKPFMPIFFEERWEQDIGELRRELCIPPLPSVKVKK